MLKTNSLFSGIALSLMAFSAKAANIDTNMAKMQAMDKITGRVSEIDIPVGGEEKFGSFSIVVRRCVTKTPEETPENTAFVDVADTYNSDEPVNIFKGWMMSSTPALSAVEHPIYDVWLLQCYDGDIKGKKILSEVELAKRDLLPMQESKIEISDEKTEVFEDDNVVNTDNTESVEEPSADNAEKEVLSIVVSAPNEEKKDGDPESLLKIEEIVVETNNKADDNLIDEENAFAEEDIEIIEIDETDVDD